MKRLTTSIGLAALMLLAISCGKTDASSEHKTDNDTLATMHHDIPRVQVMPVHMQSVAQMGEYSASVEAFKTNNISASSPNRIKSILVDIGSHVHAGQKVAVLDDASIDQLKVRLENARRQYERGVKLLEIGSGTRQSVEQLKTELDAQQRQYDNMLENTILTSPISGVVTARNYDPGDMTGQLPIVTIEQVQPVKVMVNLPEATLPKVKNGMKVDVRSDVFAERDFAGSVYLIHPSVDAATRTYTVEVTIPNGDGALKPGMFVRVGFNFGSVEHTVVPDRAVVKQTGSGNKYVYVYNPETKTVSYVKVELGQRLDDAYEILSGLNDGDVVVISGQTRLADGAHVEVLSQQQDKQ